jgi:hypothetical protein
VTVRFRHVRLRVTTTAGQFGADIPLRQGLNVIWAPNTTGKSTCLQGILYALGLERMLSPRREIPLTYVMTSHLSDPKTGGQQQKVVESSVWVELENGAGDVISVRRGVVTTVDPKLVSVFNGPLLTEPSGRHSQRDYFVRDPGAAQREAGFHHFFADFLGWSLPTVRRFDGSETTLYLETIFPLLYVEQKAGWSSIPAAFPTYFQIRDVGQRAVEFLLALETHELELKRQQLDLDLAASKAAWAAKRDELLAVAELVNARVEGVPLAPTMSSSELERAHLLVPHGTGWSQLEDVMVELRGRVADLSQAETPTVESVAPQAAVEIEQLTASVAEQNARRNALFRARQTEAAQRAAVARRLTALEEDLQKNLDVQKLRDIGSTIAETFTADQCPTCAQPIADTLLAQRAGAEVMSVEDNIEYIKAQRGIFQRLRDQTEAAAADIERQLAAATAEVNALSARLRALKADQIAPSYSPSVAAVEERIRMEARLQALEDAQERFDLRKAELVAANASHAALLTARTQLPTARLTQRDRGKVARLQTLIRDQATNYGFTTFPAAEIEVSEDNYRPQKEGFEIGFELSASDAIRLKWAYQLALLELGRDEHTNHPGFVIFDEPRQQETAKISFRSLLERAAGVSAAGQQVIFATSEDREQLEQFLAGVDCQLLEFDGPIVRRL